MSRESLKLTVHLGERSRTGGRFVADELLGLYGRRGVATSILLRGMEGFGLEHHLRTDSSLTLSEDLPAVAIAVDSPARIEDLLADVTAVCGRGLITLERARLMTGEVPPPGGADEGHEAIKLTVYCGRQERVHRVPAYVAVCELLQRRGIAGATAVLGVDGTVRGRRVRARFLGANSDVPMLITAVGAGDRIGATLPELGDLLRDPLITLERARLCKRAGVPLSMPHDPPGTDEHGRALWQKLTIYTSEAQLHGGRPVHRGIMRALRESGAAGATTLRGIWGFQGGDAPHGDRAWQWGRHVPTVTTVIDSPERIAASYAVVDSFTTEHGLVTSELVPAVRAAGHQHERGGLGLADHDY